MTMSTEPGRPVVATIANGKGGVGKTSVTVNVAAAIAAFGPRTLVVDLDPQGNTALDLGVYEHDGGASLASAVSYGTPLAPIPDVRPNLSYLPGGDATAALHAVLQQQEGRHGPQGLTKLRDVLWSLTGLDLVLIDTPAAHSNRPVIDAALIASDWVLIPTKHDAGSLLGIGGVVERIREVKAKGLSLVEPLGVVLFGLSASSKALRAEAATELREGLDGIPLLESVIRSSERAAYDLRDRGLTAGEYAESAAGAAAARLAALRTRQTGTLQRFASGADGLADDYWGLSQELLVRMGFTAQVASS